MNEPAYASDFSDLFKPSVTLEKEISKNLDRIDGDFISITFRFIGCLGDFIDRPDLFPPLETIVVQFSRQKSEDFLVSPKREAEWTGGSPVDGYAA